MDRALKNAKIYICGFLMFLCLIPYLNVALYKNGFLFIMYLIFYVYIPGFSLYKKFKLGFNYLITFLCSFYLGVAVIIIEYFICFALNVIFLIKYVNIILSIVIIIDSIKRNNIKLNTLKPKINIEFLLTIIIIFFVSYFLCLFMTNFKFPYDYSLQYPDRSFQISNIAGFATTEPFNSMTVYGSEFKYHYFFYLFLAIAKVIFNIDAYMLLNHYVSLFVPILITASFYEFFKNVTRKKTLITILSLITIFNCLAINSTLFIIHLESSHNAVGFGIPLFLLLVLLLKKYFQINSLRVSDLILFTLLVFVLTGVKGPFGLMLVAATIFYNYLFKKNYHINVLMALMVLTFVFIYFFVLSSKNSNLYTYNAEPLGNITIYFFKDYYHKLNSKFLKLLVKLLYFIPNLIMQFNIFIIPMVYYVVYSLFSFFKIMMKK